MSLEKVCDLSALEPAETLRAEVTDERGNKIPIAVVRDEEGGWHAIDALCTHGDVALDEGDVEGCAIECWGARCPVRSQYRTAHLARHRAS